MGQYYDYPPRSSVKRVHCLLIFQRYSPSNAPALRPEMVPLFGDLKKLVTDNSKALYRGRPVYRAPRFAASRVGRSLQVPELPTLYLDSSDDNLCYPNNLDNLKRISFMEQVNG